METFLHENVEIQNDIQVRFLIYEDKSLLVTNHWHNSLEILLIRSGAMNAWVNDNLCPLEKDDFIIINSRDIHATRCIKPSFVQLLQIPYHFLQARIPDIDAIRFDPAAISGSANASSLSEQITRLLYKMGDVYEARNTGYALLFQSLLYELLYLLVRDLRVDISSSVKYKNDSNRKRLMLIIEYVKLHYAEPITLTRVASHVCLNPQYFCRYFKKNMGTTLLDYVNEIRMSHIYKDILDTKDNITQILERHGFTNYKLFIQMFREKYGCTPMQLRRQADRELQSDLRRRHL